MLPLEFIVEMLINPLKGILAHELAERGYSQSRIGQLLGISQPAVSIYLKNPKSHYEDKLLKALDKRQLDSLVRSVIALVETSSAEEIIRYITNYSIALLSSLRLCQYHKAQYPTLQNCEICRDLSVNSETAQQLELALEILRACVNCYKLVPKVLMNIVEVGPEGALAFPGRLHVEGTRIVARGKPKPDASRFLAKLVLEVAKLYSEIRSVANIAYVAADCAEEKFSVARVGPSNSEDEIINNIVSVFRKGIFDIVYDEGGHGIEPNAYVFGTNAIDVASKIVEIAKCL